MRKCYFSKCYKELYSAGSKAKTDMEQIMSDLGYQNIGMSKRVSSNKVLGFFITLLSIIKVIFNLRNGDILVIQYPLKKYYALLCNAAHFKRAKVITLIHDLGSFRRKKLTYSQEICRLQHSDYLITLNDSMSAWLKAQGCTVPMGSLMVWDYLSLSSPSDEDKPVPPFYTVVYAGALGRTKNRFLYDLDSLSHQWKLCIYGMGFEPDQIVNKEQITYKGFLPADELISSVKGDFGLVWDGDSYSACVGNFGEYLQYNNPHKVSLYIRCHLPLIIWEKAALASFIKKEGIGLCVNSLEELDGMLSALSPEEYAKMKDNVRRISSRLSEGYYFRQALANAGECLSEGLCADKA